jgi:hypothetical protein
MSYLFSNHNARLCLYAWVVLALLGVVAFSQPFELSLKKRELSLATLTAQRERRGLNVTLPLGGAIGSIGLYFTEITVGGQVFRVSIVRIFAHKASTVLG